MISGCGYKSFNGDIPLCPLLAQQEFELPIATWPPGSAEELLQELSIGSALSLRQGEMGGRGWGPMGTPKKTLKKRGKSQHVDIFLLGKSTINVQNTTEPLGKSTINDNFSIAILT